MKYIDKSIINKRRLQIENVDSLVSSIDSKISALDLLEHSLSKISGTRSSENRKRIREYIEGYEKVRTKLCNIKKRWNSGVIRIAIGGLEKAGKTTFLTNLTKINLPTAQERCTATLCEIENNPEKSAVLKFFSERDFLNTVIFPDVKRLNEVLANPIPIPQDLNQFFRLKLPARVEVDSSPRIRSILDRLLNIQNNRAVLEKWIGHDDEIISVDKITDWVAHRGIEEKNRTENNSIVVKKCIVKAPFSVDDAPVVLLDTPGIDDPNPKAREMCLNLVKNEADLLLVMSRPKDTPSPVQSFQDFISSVKEFDKSVSVQDMLLYLLNEDKRISDSKLSLNKHRIELENEPYCIPNEKMIDVDASDEKSIGLCLEKVNEYLSVNLPIRDKRILEYVNQELKIINGKTIEFLNLSRFDIPTDLDAITANRFDDWFSECWKKFNYKTKELISAIAHDEKIEQLRGKMQNQFKTDATNFYNNIPNEQALDIFSKESERLSPVQCGSFYYAVPEFNKLLNKTAKQIFELAPIIRSKFVNLLEDIGFGPLLNGNSEKEKLECFISEMNHAGLPFECTESMKEILDLSDNMAVILRWELRPLVKFLNFQQCDTPEHCAKVEDEIFNLRKAYGAKSDFSGAGFFGSTAGDLKNRIAYVINTMGTVMNNNKKYDFGAMASDVISNWYDTSVLYCSFDSTMQNRSEGRDVWLKTLRTYADKLVPDIAREKQNSAAYREISCNFENAIKEINK